MVKFLIISLGVLFLTSCSDDGAESNVEIEITPANPIVITSNTTDRVTTTIEGITTTEVITVPGPFMRIGFNIRNDFTETITLSDATFFITGPDNQERIFSFVGVDDAGEPLSFFALLRPEKDADCDGLVSEEEKAVTSPVLSADCPLDTFNPSFTGKQTLIGELLGEILVQDVPDNLRRGIYNVKVRFTGWVGPVDAPKRNFLKEIFFTAESI